MTTRRPETYFCQNAACGNSIKTKEMQYGVTCQACKKAKMDDWPPDAEAPTSGLEDEASLEYFDRYIAGDR